MSREEYAMRRIEMIEGELQQLKGFISAGTGKVVSLRGIWHGVDITDQDIEEAKRSLFKGIKFDDPR